jgi:hypothetical protein
MTIRIERQGQRIYFVGDTFAAKDRIKALGAKPGELDGRFAWWVGVKKLAQAEALVAELSAPSAAVQEAAAKVGLDPSAPAGVIADKLDEEGHAAQAEAIRNPPKAKQDPADIRLTGKGEYKGRAYYMGSQTKDSSRVRLLTLPDAKGEYLDFWADVSAVKVIKTYAPRDVWDGRRYSGRTVKQYTTLGSIADFIAREQRNRKAGGAVCAACGKSGELVEDLEDGLQKHRACCDIPPN